MYESCIINMNVNMINIVEHVSNLLIGVFCFDVAN